MKKIWIVRAEYIDRYDEPESNVRLTQYYETREDAHRVYAHGEKMCAEKGITELHWSLHSIYIEERVEFGMYMADKIIEEHEVSEYLKEQE